ncbi:MAG: CARDB domain-containing protein, partial [Candidatus Thermoplasmatota archaeon]|nr:CARDB domain-containing protein [Candidatus Thermoplasmatota archaeon]
DSGSWQLATGTTTWSFVWDTTTVSNGWHTIYARAWDGIDYSETKSVNVYVDNPAPLPDLAISPEDITILPSNTVSNGTTITINATVHNIGNAAAPNITVRFYADTTLIATKTISSLSPTSSITLSTTWTATPAGNYTVKVIVDPDNLTAESDETNNEATKILTVVTENIPPVANFVFYQGTKAIDGEYVNITLRVAGRPGAVINLTLKENNVSIANLSVTRTTGKPNEASLDFLFNASRFYEVVVERVSGGGGSSVWVIVNYTNGNITSEHMVFNQGEGGEGSQILNLTQLLDEMLYSVGFVKFDASYPLSYDPDGVILNWSWNFGDNTYGYDEVVSHNYLPGNYTVTLTVRDDDNALASVTKTITVSDKLEEYATRRNQFGIALRCPADLTIINATGALLGYNESSGRHENWLPNATMIIAGDIEIYFAPGDFNYTYTIRGFGPGDFVFVFAPGDFGPGDFYKIESTTSVQDIDKIRTASDGTIILTSNSDKFYSLYITNGTQVFALRDVPINANATHIYEITNWSAISETGIYSVNLTVDELSDSIVDRVEELWTNFNLNDIFKPDLAIIELSLVARAKVGENVSVKLVIKNLGSYPAKNIKVRFLVNNESYEDFEILLLARGESMEITFYWSTQIEGRYWLSVWVDPDNDIKETDEDNNLIGKSTEIIKEAIIPTAPSPLPTPAIIGGAIAATIVIVAALLGTEVGKYSLFSFFAPLYIKRKYAALDQFTRGRIYNYIELNPGAHYNSIRSSLNLGNGTLSYHLKILEKESYIRTETEGMYRRFYV